MKEKGIFVLACQQMKNGDRDGIPNSLAEAMSMELPTVATAISGNSRTSGAWKVRTACSVSGHYRAHVCDL